MVVLDTAFNQQFLHVAPGVRPDGRLSPGERAAGRARDGLGSWAFVAAVTALVGGLRRGRPARPQRRPVAVLALALSGVSVVELSLMLMAARRTDGTAAEVALHDLESDRHAAAGIDELRDEVARLCDDLVRLTARLDTSRH